MSNFFLLQETLKLQFGTYTGEVRDGKPHGHGVFNFNPDDIQVSQCYYRIIIGQKEKIPEIFLGETEFSC